MWHACSPEKTREKINLFIDDDKITSEFISDYVSKIGTRFNYINLSEDMETALADA